MNAPLTIAMAIFRLHPRGGLEDNCIRIAEALAARGHRVTIFTTRGADIRGVDVRLIPDAAVPPTNHARMSLFAELAVKAMRNGGFDKTLAFQTMPGADYLFLADAIRRDPQTPFWKRLTARYRTYGALERATFSPQSATRIIGLAEPQMRAFTDRYQLDPARLRIAPPTLNPDKAMPAARTSAERARFRAAHTIPPDVPVWLSVCLFSWNKGLDRTIDALAAVSDAHLVVAGFDHGSKGFVDIRNRITRLKLDGRVHLLGYVQGNDLLSAMAGSDLLAHPARREVTGAVILESLLNGLPVVTTSLCGFADHVSRADAGTVLDSPFSQACFVDALKSVAADSPRLSRNALAAPGGQDFFGGIEQVCIWLESGF